jgi:hypothetical protein
VIGAHVNDSTVRRPLPLTIVAILIGISFVSLPFVAHQLISVFLERYGAWYVAMWFASLIATAALAISYRRMERWGLYVYSGMFVIGTILGLLTNLTVLGVLVPIAIIAVGFAYFPKLR